MATGYSTAVVAADSELTAHQPGILSFLPSGWTNLSVSRAEAYKRNVRHLIQQIPAVPNKTEYLARIENSAQLKDAEVYAALSHFYAAIMIREGDAHHAKHLFYEARWNEFWKTANIQWDMTVSVSELNEDATAVRNHCLLERV